MWGDVQSTRNRIRALAAFVGGLLIAASVVFVVATRADIHTTSGQLATSRDHLTQLHTELTDAVAARAEATAALDHVREVLRADTEARDRLRATNGSEYRLLIASLQTLASHQTQLEIDARRAKLLDECLIGASQALNEAAVGDVEHLGATLPLAEQLCAEAEA